MKILQKTVHALFHGLNHLKGYLVHAGCAFISSHLLPCRLQGVITTDLVVQRIETKLRFPLGLLAQFMSQGRKTWRQASYWLGHLLRNRIFQSVFPLSYINVPSAGSLGSAPFPGLPRYYGPLRLPTRPPIGYVFPMNVAMLSAPGRASQVPRQIFPRALSPVTPGDPMAAYAHYFTIDNGLHLNPGGGPLSTCVTRPNRVHLRYGSRVRSAGLRPYGLLRGPPAPLPAERAINRVPTLQGTRSDRLCLALQIHTDKSSYEFTPKWAPRKALWPSEAFAEPHSARLIREARGQPVKGRVTRGDFFWFVFFSAKK